MVNNLYKEKSGKRCENEKKGFNIRSNSFLIIIKVIKIRNIHKNTPKYLNRNKRMKKQSQN